MIVLILGEGVADSEELPAAQVLGHGLLALAKMAF